MTIFENDFITTVFKPFDTNRFRAWDKKGTLLKRRCNHDRKRNGYAVLRAA